MSADGPNVLLRADGQTATGFGHLSRVLALGEALETEGLNLDLVGSNFEKVLGQFSLSPRSISSPTSASGSPQDAANLVASRPDFLVVDGYQFTRRFFEVLEDSPIPFLVIDDNGQTQSMAPSMVVNQSPSAVSSLYSHLNSEAEFFLGPGYCLIREEFKQARDNSATVPSLGTFVSFGATDSSFMTERTLTVLTQSGFPCSVALGPGASEREKRMRKIEQSGHKIVRPHRFASDMASSELIVTAGGTAIWESAYMGVPIVALIVADNQRDPVSAAKQGGIVDWVIDVEVAGPRWVNELEQALAEFTQAAHHYSHSARTRRDQVGVLGAKYLASQIVKRIASRQGTD